MPLGIERINATRKQPNDRVVFIKPLEGPDKALAQDFLERIAAICNPIMKANHLAVMSLEEYEPNLEFVGRNFNAGEVIQLVLKAPFTGTWLPFRYVQMVMMHELAHIKQMNHSGAFWKVRNQYAKELKELWARNYAGEGFWSRGQTLLSGSYTTSALPDAVSMPKSLCGGTYRSSRKRSRKEGKGKTGKPTPTYAERKKRSIAKKFGTGGVALGSDDGSRVKLEDGKGKSKPKGKPRVAQSARGRELRAAAALARFEQNSCPGLGTVEQEEEHTSEIQSETDSDEEDVYIKKEEALDGCITSLRNPESKGMIKVCEEEDTADDNVKKELEELQQC